MERPEEWRKVTIEGCETELAVSSLGRVKVLSYMRHLGKYKIWKRIYPDRVLKTSDNGHGYKYFCVMKDGKRVHIYVHRLVAETFLEKGPDDTEVNHLDYDKGNNRVDNLEWCTRSENMKHASPRCSVPRTRRVRPSACGKYIRKRGAKYEVELHYKGKAYYIGRFSHLHEAEEARDNKFRELGAFEYVKVDNIE